METAATAPVSASLNASKSPVERALTRQERDQLLDAAAKGMAPARAQKKPEDPLKSWWPHIKRKLKQGYSVRQVHDMISSPVVGLDVSMRSLQRCIAEHNPAQSAKPTSSAK
jgi:hypothetical protein